MLIIIIRKLHYSAIIPKKKTNESFLPLISLTKGTKTQRGSNGERKTSVLTETFNMVATILKLSVTEVNPDKNSLVKAEFYKGDPWIFML